MTVREEQGASGKSVNEAAGTMDLGRGRGVALLWARGSAGWRAL